MIVVSVTCLANGGRFFKSVIVVSVMWLAKSLKYLTYILFLQENKIKNNNNKKSSLTYSEPINFLIFGFERYSIFFGAKLIFKHRL